MPQMAARPSGAWAGWIVFASTMLLIIGMINIFEGTIALFDDERLVVTPSNFVVVDLTSWGWTVIISGLLLLVAGIGLIAARTWARIMAIVIVGLHAVSQIAWLGAYPIWSLLMITLDTVVLFALTARWSEARGALATDELAPSGDRHAPTPQYRSPSVA
jgi:hypothetical protein